MVGIQPIYGNGNMGDEPNMFQTTNQNMEIIPVNHACAISGSDKTSKHRAVEVKKATAPRAAPAWSVVIFLGF
jgi:hypothetical protein